MNEIAHKVNIRTLLRHTMLIERFLRALETSRQEECLESAVAFLLILRNRRHFDWRIVFVQGGLRESH